MKLQRQKPYECFPTVCAMLLDKPVSQVKRSMLGKNLAKESWSYLISNSQSEKNWQLQANVKRYLEKHLPWLGLEAFNHVEAPSKVLTLPECNRGVAVINTHIVAFEEGLVFDPMLNAPVPVHEYQSELVKRNKVVKLVVLDPNT